MRKKSTTRSQTRGYIGSNTFINEQPVCKPTIPGRIPKALEGPVHPGFKGKPKPKKKKVATKPVLVRSSQNNDLYKPLKKKVSRKRVTRRR